MWQKNIGMLGQMMEPVEIKPTAKKNHDFSWVVNGEADKRERNMITSLSLWGEVLEKMNTDRFEQYADIAKKHTMVENTVKDGDEVAIVAYGAPSRVCVNAIDELKTEGINVGLIRPSTVWPFPYDIFHSVPSSVKHILVCELSMGQMVEDVRLGVEGKYPVHFYGRTGGSIFEPKEIAAKVRELVGKGAK
jgi:2-oxoglutarate ferredoxin oxidoreductase subunit alpha